VKVLILGTAAGGGLPQWNCACEQCAQARQHGSHRTQDCLAISGDGRRWYLVNASPDIRTQINNAGPLTPGPARRETPIVGTLFTDAELDHTLGLLALRENTGMRVYGTNAVLAALTEAFPVRRILDPYGSVTWHEMTPRMPCDLDERLRVTAIQLGAKRPRYAVELENVGSGWVVAYRFEDRDTGGVFVYAPCLASWSASVDAALDGAHYAVVDGTFFHDDEMTRATGSGGTARSMGHLPIVDSLDELRKRPGVRVLYTHLNNTNPVLNEHGEERRTLDALGIGVARDGQLIEL
jgi:pyrroloquinoline quinone biosynthesis protein B